MWGKIAAVVALVDTIFSFIYFCFAVMIIIVWTEIADARENGPPKEEPTSAQWNRNFTRYHLGKHVGALEEGGSYASAFLWLGMVACAGVLLAVALEKLSGKMTGLILTGVWYGVSLALFIQYCYVLSKTNDLRTTFKWTHGNDPDDYLSIAVIVFRLIFMIAVAPFAWELWKK